ncbi:MAG: Mov34/MPN/PAD-1 family protein [Nocardioidaceae bacterium]
MSGVGSAGLLVVRTAITAATETGRQALPQETGGILMGFRTPDTIVVTQALTVPDPNSSANTYLRRRRHAQALMAASLRHAHAVVGYVGEWHTHPHDQGPSTTDIRAIADTARLVNDPVALIVISYPATGPARAYARVAVRRCRWPTVLVHPVSLISNSMTITNDTAGSLEAEAAAALSSQRGKR